MALVESRVGVESCMTYSEEHIACSLTTKCPAIPKVGYYWKYVAFLYRVSGSFSILDIRIIACRSQKKVCQKVCILSSPASVRKEVNVTVNRHDEESMRHDNPWCNRINISVATRYTLVWKLCMMIRFACAHYKPSRNLNTMALTCTVRTYMCVRLIH